MEPDFLLVALWDESLALLQDTTSGIMLSALATDFVSLEHSHHTLTACHFLLAYIY